MGSVTGRLATLCTGHVSIGNCTFSPSASLRGSFRQHFRCSRASSRLEYVGRVGTSVRHSMPVSHLLYNSINFNGARITLHTTFGYVDRNGRYTLLMPAAVLTLRRCGAVIHHFNSVPIAIGLLGHFIAPGKRRGVVDSLGYNELSVIINARHLVSGSVSFGSLKLIVVSRRRHFNITRGRQFGRLCPSISVLALSTAPVPHALGVTVSNLESVSSLSRTPNSERPMRACILRRGVNVVASTVGGRVHHNNRICCLRGDVSDVSHYTTEVGTRVPSVGVNVTRNEVSRSRLSRI